ncbi:MAG: AAA family ATPase, partial [Planctomycetota bacterium]
GGVGTTTIACNLAMELGQLIDQHCALIDMNLTLGDVECFFDVDTMYSIADVCQEGDDTDHFKLKKAFYQLPCQVSILNRPENLKDADSIEPNKVADMLTVARQIFPYIVIDLPWSFNDTIDALLKHIDQVIIVTQLGVSCIRNADRIYEHLCQAGVTEDNIEIVLNRCQADFANLTPKDIENHFNKPVFGMIPNDYQQIKLSWDKGQPLIADDTDSPIRAAIHEMACKITGHPGQIQKSSAAKQGWFGRIWKRIPKETQPKYHKQN